MKSVGSSLRTASLVGGSWSSRADNTACARNRARSGEVLSSEATVCKKSSCPVPAQRCCLANQRRQLGRQGRLQQVPPAVVKASGYPDEDALRGGRGSIWRVESRLVRDGPKELARCQHSCSVLSSADVSPAFALDCGHSRTVWQGLARRRRGRRSMIGSGVAADNRSICRWRDDGVSLKTARGSRICRIISWCAVRASRT